MDARLISNLNELHALRYVKWRQTFYSTQMELSVLKCSSLVHF